MSLIHSFQVENSGKHLEPPSKPKTEYYYKGSNKTGSLEQLPTLNTISQNS